MFREESVRSTVFEEAGKFAGWPANYGMWSHDGDVVVMFLVGTIGPLAGVHARRLDLPFVPVQARSRDCGRTWSIEEFPGTTPGAAVLSGDEHQVARLQAGPAITGRDFVPRRERIDFTDPGTWLMGARTDLAAGSISWFYVSTDRAHHWSGPHRFPDFGLPGIAARTDPVPLSSSEALWMVTASKEDGTEGRVFAAHSADGGRTFTRRGWLGEEPTGLQIMPSSVRLADGPVLTAVRCHEHHDDGPDRFWIDLWESSDVGTSWMLRSTPVADTGPAGNPPVLLRHTVGLICMYGFRGPGSGLRYVLSTDDGRSWSAPIILTEDSAMGDMGYPRALVLEDDSVLACFYTNEGPESPRAVEAVRWIP